MANLERSTRPHEDRQAILHQTRPQTQLASQQQPSLSKKRGKQRTWSEAEILALFT